MHDPIAPSLLTPQTLQLIPPEASKALGLVVRRLAHDLRSPLSGLSLGLFRLDELLATAPTQPGDPAERLEALVAEVSEIGTILYEVLDQTVAQADRIGNLGEDLLDGAPARPEAQQPGL